MALLEIPDGVGIANVGTVGNVARIVLLSDGRLACAACGVFAFDDGALQMAAVCEHLGAMAYRGWVQRAIQADGRTCHEWVWARSGDYRVRAEWPESDDPHGVLNVLAAALLETRVSRPSYGADRMTEARGHARALLIRLGRQGLVLVPEWLSRTQKSDETGRSRGARLIDLGDE